MLKFGTTLLNGKIITVQVKKLFIRLELFAFTVAVGEGSAGDLETTAAS